ncbi:MAG: LamG domain-containing protein, partial [Sandaracinaceae bacterium]
MSQPRPLAAAWSLSSIAIAILSTSCGGDAACTEGMSVACACTDGRTGAQVCTDGVLQACMCTGGPGMDAGPIPGIDGGGADGGRDGGSDPGSDAGMSTADGGGSDAGGSVVDGGGSDAGAMTDAGGGAGYVLHLPTDDSRVLVSDVGGDLYDPLFTYELWVYFDRIIPGLVQPLLLATTSAGHLWLRMDDLDNLSCSTRTTAFENLRASLANASVHITAAAWHHVACVSNGSNRLELYVDGIQRAVGTTPGTMELPAAGTLLGIGQITQPLPAATLRFQGYIDEVRVSNARRYTGPFTPARHLAVDASTVALFRFDEGTGTTTTDAVGPGRHAAVLEFGAL